MSASEAVKAAQASNGSYCAQSAIPTKKNKSSETLINLEPGDPTMYETYWAKMEDKGSIMIPGGQKLSYFSSADDLCWFMEPELSDAIRRLHSVVGNAVAEDKFIVVGTGSTQLLFAALYALTCTNSHLLDQPVPVVSAAPFYSCYPGIADLVRSGLYKWGGDAGKFDREEPFIEIVNSPCNPDGSIRGPVVPQNDSRKGKLIHDFAYFWPQYTPIGAPADHDIMLFTLSKCTGHAGSRIGWALVKDRSLAEKMVGFINIATIGVSKDAQLRAAKLMGALADQCGRENDFFKYGQRLLTDRWRRLREVVDKSEVFTVKDYESDYCSFFKDIFKPNPAFAWLSCDHISDTASFLQG
uniref:Alliinase C-terminal domain-containing protein n=2 Tax=Kalanchoe fedtschenkoi TaxID=63787 RepID=A0A7N0U0Z5_KALFE